MSQQQLDVPYRVLAYRYLHLPILTRLWPKIVKYSQYEN